MIEQRRSAGTGVPTARARARGGGGVEVADDRIAELEARLAKLERSPGLRQRGRSLMDRVIPREASHHFRNAGREELLGIRAIVDFWIDRIDEAEGRSGSGTRRESIEIE
jgi:hypothetical protein